MLVAMPSTSYTWYNLLILVALCLFLLGESMSISYIGDYGKVLVNVASVVFGYGLQVSTPHSDSSIKTVTRSNVLYQKSSTGIEYYDYSFGDGPAAGMGDRVSINVKGFLAGRQGWVYEDTYGTDRPVRLILGSTPCIAGLEQGLAGTTVAGNDDMPPMHVGGKRRLVIPARLGYVGRDQEPIPSDEGQRRRLYSTVLNNVRGDREAAALGDSLTGKIVLDVQLLRLRKE